MTHTEHRPAETEAIEDARLRLRQAASAVQSAASVAPDRAADLARCHSLLADALDVLETVQ